MLVVITLILAPRAEWAHSFEAGGGGCLGRESTLRDGNDLTRKAVNADNHRFTHQVNLADRFAAKSHAPDLAFVFKRLNRLDALLVTAVVIPRVANEMAPLSWRVSVPKTSSLCIFRSLEPSVRTLTSLKWRSVLTVKLNVINCLLKTRSIMQERQGAEREVQCLLKIGILARDRQSSIMKRRERTHTKVQV